MRQSRASAELVARSFPQVLWHCFDSALYPALGYFFWRLVHESAYSGSLVSYPNIYDRGSPTLRAARVHQRSRRVIEYGISSKVVFSPDHWDSMASLK